MRRAIRRLPRRDIGARTCPRHPHIAPRPHHCLRMNLYLPLPLLTLTNHTAITKNTIYVRLNRGSWRHAPGNQTAAAARYRCIHTSTTPTPRAAPAPLLARALYLPLPLLTLINHQNTIYFRLNRGSWRHAPGDQTAAAARYRCTHTPTTPTHRAAPAPLLAHDLSPKILFILG
jgi:hypothetical protein